MKIGVRLVVALATMLVVIWGVMIYWTYSEYRQAAVNQAHEFADSIHTMTLASLTGMMISGTMAERDVFLDQVRSHGDVRSLRVLRGNGVTQQYQTANPAGEQPDADESQVLESGAALFRVEPSGDILHAVIPVLAKANFLGKNCLQCHLVPEDSVLGVVSMRISLEKNDAAVRAFTYKLVGMAVILAALMLLYIHLFVRKTVSQPLASVGSRLHAIADGDLSGDIPARGNDEIGDLLHSLQSMQNALRDLVGNVQRIVQFANQGDFSQRIDTTLQQGYGRDICAALNQLCATTQIALSDVQRVSGALAGGELNQKIAKDYPGVFGQTKESVNNTVDALATLIAEIQSVVESGVMGDFSQHLEMTGKVGYSQTLAELLNQLATTTDIALRDVMRVAQALAHGDLTQTLTTDYPGLFGQTKDGINTTVANLQGLVRQIKAATEAIAQGAQGISEGSQDLTARTEKQVQAIQETASGLELFKQTVRKNADHARQACLLAAEATQVAQRGGQVVGESVQTMVEISLYSSKIADIIGLIDSIAFQTNILALNAAVEAARAGEQGRGFAVVASEVRSLAHRSAEAAREIKALITTSVGKIDEGTERANQAGQAMAGIVTAIRSVAELITDISSAGAEQSASIDRFHQSIAEIDQATRQNANAVFQAAENANRLLEQAEQLERSITAFRLDAGGRPALPNTCRARGNPPRPGYLLCRGVRV